VLNRITITWVRISLKLCLPEIIQIGWFLTEVFKYVDVLRGQHIWKDYWPGCSPTASYSVGLLPIIAISGGRTTRVASTISRLAWWGRQHAIVPRRQSGREVAAAHWGHQWWLATSISDGDVAVITLSTIAAAPAANVASRYGQWRRSDENIRRSESMGLERDGRLPSWVWGSIADFFSNSATVLHENPVFRCVLDKKMCIAMTFAYFSPVQRDRIVILEITEI